MQEKILQGGVWDAFIHQSRSLFFLREAEASPVVSPLIGWLEALLGAG